MRKGIAGFQGTTFALAPHFFFDQSLLCKVMVYGVCIVEGGGGEKVKEKSRKALQAERIVIDFKGLF
ncbi:MAG: hypothetical protein GY777_23560 [Candidatus Brocadiaceae bacterium]|nr:hypothetical protein [Candidatus Brocadiaceae bacterium]